MKIQEKECKINTIESNKRRRNKKEGTPESGWDEILAWFLEGPSQVKGQGDCNSDILSLEVLSVARKSYCNPESIMYTEIMALYSCWLSIQFIPRTTKRTWTRTNYLWEEMKREKEIEMRNMVCKESKWTLTASSLAIHKTCFYANITYNNQSTSV